MLSVFTQHSDSFYPSKGSTLPPNDTADPALISEPNPAGSLALRVEVFSVNQTWDLWFLIGLYIANLGA